MSHELDFIQKVISIPTYCGAVYESVHSLDRGHVIRVCQTHTRNTPGNQTLTRSTPGNQTLMGNTLENQTLIRSIPGNQTLTRNTFDNQTLMRSTLGNQRLVRNTFDNQISRRRIAYHEPNTLHGHLYHTCKMCFLSIACVELVYYLLHMYYTCISKHVIHVQDIHRYCAYSSTHVIHMQAIYLNYMCQTCAFHVFYTCIICVLITKTPKTTHMYCTCNTHVVHVIV